MLYMRIMLELVVQKCIESDVVIIKDGSRRVATRPRGMGHTRQGMKHGRFVSR